MDNHKIEFEVTEEHGQTDSVKLVSELAELQLVLIGGGHGEVMF